MNRLAQQVLFNCDVSDARYAGIYSICGLAMRLRDLYKWERRMAPWQEDEAAQVLDWIGAKEDRWENLLEADYSRLEVGNTDYEAFDTQGINAVLVRRNCFYGAGYAHHLKPTFVLADTGPHGALTILLKHRDTAALGLYMAYGNGMIRLLTHELICAFDAFIQNRRWDPLISASHALRQKVVSHAHRVMELFTRGQQRQDPEGTRKAIEDFMRRQGWLSNQALI
jgi:hypothetical protein